MEKPPNVPVQEDSSGDMDLLNMLKQYLKVKFNKPGDVYLGLVHRLDRPARGVMIFARTSKAAGRLSDQFRSRSVSKIYRAVVSGNPPAGGKLTNFLWKDRSKNTVYVANEEHPEAKPARLRFKTLSQKNGLSMMEIELETGRPHQIRVQCAHAGFPLWGDYRYGDSRQPDGRNLALLSAMLTVKHPVKKNPMTFTVSEPDEEPWTHFK